MKDNVNIFCALLCLYRPKKYFNYVKLFHLLPSYFGCLDKRACLSYPVKMVKIKARTTILLSITLFCSLLFGAILGLMLALTVNTINTENFTEFTAALPTKLLDINGELITEFASDEKREIISLTNLPQHMIDALISREDRVFYEHNGFRLMTIFRAFLGVITNVNLGGGSTLTQQIAGTLYCDRTEKSLSRKIKELWWAIQMERRYSKDEILEFYLNKIYFGSGTYGVNAASKYYFGHDATQITPAEAAILVVQLSSPVYNNPFEYPNSAMEKQKGVLAEMVSAGYLTQEAATASFDDFWANFDYTRINSSAYLMREDKAPWFSEYVRRELNTMLYGTDDIYTSGFTVNTTLNLKHQLAAQEVMNKHIDRANESYQRSSNLSKSSATDTYIPMTELISLVFNLPQLKQTEENYKEKAVATYVREINPIVDIMSLMCGFEDLKLSVVNKGNAQQKEYESKTVIEGALISVENETGYITAIVGGREYSSNNQLIRATQALVQPGSSLKPLYYSAALDSGLFTPASVLVDTPTVFYTEDGRPYIPLNFRNVWEGSVLLWYALATSMNVPSVKVMDGIGFDAAIERATALLGIPQTDWEKRGFTHNYPLALGVCSVRPIEMAKAFATFGNQGKSVDPIAVLSIEDRNGKEILNPEKELRLKQQAMGDARQVISPQNAYVMTSILQKTVTIGTLARGSNYGLRFKYTAEDGSSYTMPAAGKTGTTQNWADAWAVGFTPYITTAIWFGFDTPGQSLGTELTGSTLSGWAWGEYMRIANEDYPYKEFPMPESGVTTLTVCSKSGLLPTEACGKSTLKLYFISGTEPTESCQYHTIRQTSSAIGIERLKKERTYTSAGFESSFIGDTPLEFNLDFLTDDKLLYAPVETTENNTQVEIPVDSNFLLD